MHAGLVGCPASPAFPAGGDAYGSIQKQLELFARLPGPAVVVFEDIDDPPVAAVFGEVMCSTYQAFGSVGRVTNAAIVARFTGSITPCSVMIPRR